MPQNYYQMPPNQLLQSPPPAYSSPFVQHVSQDLREMTLSNFSDVKILHHQEYAYTFAVDRAQATEWTLTGYEYQAAEPEAFSITKGCDSISHEMWAELIPAKESLQIQILATMCNLALFGFNPENCGALMIFFFNDRTMVIGRGKTVIWEMEKKKKKK